MDQSRRRGLALTLVVACGGLAACAEGPSAPAPVFMYGAVGTTATPSAAAESVPSADTRFVVVRPGQSLGRIAEANHVSKQAIIATNHLSATGKLKIGQRLALPTAAETAATRDRRSTTALSRSQHATVVADRRSSGSISHSGKENLIPLDDPVSPNDNRGSVAPTAASVSTSAELGSDPQLATSASH